MATTAGFCFGVKRAVDLVYAECKNSKDVYTFGPIIHNEEVVNDLASKGVKVLNSIDELKSLESGTVIIRAHGVSKEVFDIIDSLGLKVVDATCPFVRKIYKIVTEESNNGRDIIIIGSDTHPEVEGIKGWCNSKVHVIENEDEASNLSLPKETKLCIVSQTTFNHTKFKEIVDIISNKTNDVIVLNTICNATEDRQKEAYELAKTSDAMIVIGGRHSSNTQKLYNICSKECKNTYYIQTVKDLDFSELKSFNNVGITAGASTPNNIIKEVYTQCQK